MEKLLVILFMLPLSLFAQKVEIRDTLQQTDRVTIIRVQHLDTSEVLNSYIFDLQNEIKEYERMIKELQDQRKAAIRRLARTQQRINGRLR